MNYMALNAAQLRALVEAANEEVVAAQTSLLAAKERAEEAISRYRSISPKLAPSIIALQHVVSGIEEEWTQTGIAITEANNYTALL
jgi:uncharacterized protein YegP (UPF0339 family)